jgi:hypothetical protein
MATPELFAARTQARSQYTKAARKLKSVRSQIADMAEIDELLDVDERLFLLEEEEKKLEVEVLEMLKLKNEVEARCDQHNNLAAPIPATPNTSKQKPPQIVTNDMYSPFTMKEHVSYDHTSHHSLRGLTPGAISKVSIVLEDELLVKNHISSFEMILAEMNAGHFDVDNNFVLCDSIKVSACHKLVSSFSKFPDIKGTAEDAVRGSFYDWDYVKHELISRYCRASVLRSAYFKSIQDLKSPTAASIDVFLRGAVKIFKMYQQVFPNDKSELRAFTRTIVSKLPTVVAERVIEKIRERCGTAGFDDQWEDLLPFDALPGRHSVVEVIRMTCRIIEEVNSMGTLYGRSSKAKETFPDSDYAYFIGRVQSQKLPNNTSDGAVKNFPKKLNTPVKSVPNIRHWEAQYKKILYVSGPGSRDITVAWKDLKCDNAVICGSGYIGFWQSLFVCCLQRREKGH